MPVRLPGGIWGKEKKKTSYSTPHQKGATRKGYLAEKNPIEEAPGRNDVAACT